MRCWILCTIWNFWVIVSTISTAATMINYVLNLMTASIGRRLKKNQKKYGQRLLYWSMPLCRFVSADCCVCPLCVCVCEKAFFFFLPPLVSWPAVWAGGRTQGVSHHFNETCIVGCRGFSTGKRLQLHPRLRSLVFSSSVFFLLSIFMPFFFWPTFSEYSPSLLPLANNKPNWIFFLFFLNFFGLSLRNQIARAPLWLLGACWAASNWRSTLETHLFWCGRWRFKGKRNSYCSTRYTCTAASWHVFFICHERC